MKIRVYYEDTDAGGVVYHSHYLNFCERARSEAFFSTADIFDAVRGHFLVSKANCAFLKSAHLGDILDVRSAILQIKNASVIIRQEIFKVNSREFSHKIQSENLGENLGEKVFSAEFTLVFVKNSKPSPMGADLKAKFMKLFRE